LKGDHGCDGALSVHTVDCSWVEAMSRKRLLQCLDVVAVIALLKQPV
jgi:hypothetical protein